MKAIILAAGKATRLLPLTKETHQCLLKINKKTILEYQVELLRKAGITEIIVVTGFMADQVEKFCENKGVKTILNPFYSISGMAMTLWISKEYLKNGFLFLYSDILFDSDVVKKLLEVEGDVVLAVKKNGLREEAEKVIEFNGFVETISKTDVKGGNGEFIGIAKFSKMGSDKLVQKLNEIAKIEINTSFINVIDRLIEGGEKVTAFDIQESQFIDIDFPEDLEKAKKLF